MNNNINDNKTLSTYLRSVMISGIISPLGKGQLCFRLRQHPKSNDKTPEKLGQRENNNGAAAQHYTIK